MAISLLVVSCTTSQTVSSAESTVGSLVISPKRIGPWSVGIPYTEMAKNTALKLQYSSETTGSANEVPTGRGCEYFSMGDSWPGLGFMFEDGVLTRIDLFDPNSRNQPPAPMQAVTERGIKIGDTIAKAKAAYGSTLQITPHPYLEDAGSYLTVSPEQDRQHGIVFETEGQTITSLRVGNKNSVQYIEGCL